MDKLIRNLLPPADRNPFDVILVAQSDGAVVFQRAAPQHIGNADWRLQGPTAVNRIDAG